MMTLSVHGLACLGSFGSGIGDLLREAPLPFVGEEGLAAGADLAALKDRLPARALRQMDHFTRMALLCLLEALEDAGMHPETDLTDTGIILVTGYGPASPTFAFLDSLLAHGEQLASPLSFSHSVHNIPAASLAMHFGITGPCMTFCQMENPVAAGFLAARQWLAEGRADRVLLGAVDEQTPLLAQVTRRMVSRRIAATRVVASSHAVRAALPVSEGAAFFCLGPAGEPGRRGQVTAISIRRGEQSLPMECGEEAVFLSGAVPPPMLDLPGTAHLGKVYGNIPVAQAFDVTFALTDRGRVPLGKACCHSRGSHGETACIHVCQPEEEGVVV